MTFTTLYPDRTRPRHGIFVETRLRQLIESGEVEARVIAPVPWFPSSHRLFGEYAAFAAVPAEEERHGIRVAHPRYPSLPRVGMTLAPYLLAAAARPALRRLRDTGYDFEMIDAHYFYPDGVAAALLGRSFARPVVITARGSDINLIAGYRLPRRMIVWAAQRAAAVITVSRALREALVDIGVPKDKINVLRNGVDPRTFCPADRDVTRRRLAIDGPMLLSVGNLVSNKGHDVVIRALAELPGTRLVIVGDGEEAESLHALARAMDLAPRVHFAGVLSQDELRTYYSAADALVLASSREGWPNVLLEAMACGTPVIATMVGGVPEVVTAPEAGVLIAERTPEAVAAAARRLWAVPPDRDATRRYAARFSWEETTRGQVRLFRRVLADRGA